MAVLQIRASAFHPPTHPPATPSSKHPTTSQPKATLSTFAVPRLCGNTISPHPDGSPATSPRPLCKHLFVPRFYPFDDDWCSPPSPLSPLPDFSWWDKLMNEDGTVKQEVLTKQKKGGARHKAISSARSLFGDFPPVPEIPGVAPLCLPPATVALDTTTSTTSTTSTTPSPSPSPSTPPSPVFGPYENRRTLTLRSGGKVGMVGRKSCRIAASGSPPVPCRVVNQAIREGAACIDLCGSGSDTEGSADCTEGGLPVEPEFIEHEEVELSDSPLPYE